MAPVLVPGKRVYVCVPFTSLYINACIYARILSDRSWIHMYTLYICMYTYLTVIYYTCIYTCLCTCTLFVCASASMHACIDVNR